MCAMLDAYFLQWLTA